MKKYTENEIKEAFYKAADEKGGINKNVSKGGLLCIFGQLADCGNFDDDTDLENQMSQLVDFFNKPLK
jgi:hypothetical protein